MTLRHRGPAFALIILLVAATGGCAAAAISGGTYAVKATKRSDLKTLAEVGDAQAQYELGKSWCCMGPGFDTQTATEWLCKAANQNHPQALYELGRIYSGDISRTPTPGQKLMKLAKAKNSDVHALAFFALAEQLGNEKAGNKVEKLRKSLDNETEALARELQQNLSHSCICDVVFAEHN